MKKALEAFGLGIGFMLVALILQSAFETIPSGIALFSGFFLGGANPGAVPTINLAESPFLIPYAIFIGLLAGTMQESTKYVAVDSVNKRYALLVGLGYSSVDITLILIGVLYLNHAMFQESFAILIILNIITSLFFHPGTAFILKWGALEERKGVAFSISILSHAAIDGGLVYADGVTLLSPSNGTLYSAIYWILVVIITAIIIITGIRLIRKSKENSAKVEEPVVF